MKTKEIAIIITVFTTLALGSVAKAQMDCVNKFGAAQGLEGTGGGHGQSTPQAIDDAEYWAKKAACRTAEAWAAAGLTCDPGCTPLPPPFTSCDHKDPSGNGDYPIVPLGNGSGINSPGWFEACIFGIMAMGQSYDYSKFLCDSLANSELGEIVGSFYALAKTKANAKAELICIPTPAQPGNGNGGE